MKIAVITRHSIINYGSLLQAYATQKVLENLGYSCQVIDYIRKDETYYNREKTLLAGKPKWNKDPVRRFVYLGLRQPESILAGKRFEKYQNKYLNLTRRYCSFEELKKDKPEADVFMTGSDQVWGPIENGSYDDCYFLSFTDDSDRRISYAASFGRTDLSHANIELFQKWLPRYEKISVREDSAVEILGNMKIAAMQSLDPTLLLDRTHWDKLTKNVPVDEYILIYQIHNDRRLGKYAKKVADKLGIKLIRVSPTFHQIASEGKLVWCPDPSMFLSYVKNAKCMITDSFHGTAFAINFNTPFVEILPENKTGTRNMSILRLIGLEERILRDNEDVALALNPIDFREANKLLQDERTKSLSILKSMIEIDKT